MKEKYLKANGPDAGVRLLSRPKPGEDVPSRKTTSDQRKENHRDLQESGAEERGAETEDLPPPKS